MYLVVALVAAIAIVVLSARRDERWTWIAATVVVGGSVLAAAMVATASLAAPGYVVDPATHIPTGELFPGYLRLLTPFFSSEPVTNYAAAAACDLDAYGAWCRALLERGVYPPASQFEAWFPSLAHTPEHIARTIHAAAAAFAEVS